MYDITDKSSLSALTDQINEIEQHFESNITLILVGNKSDLEEDRQVTTEDGQKFAEEFGMEFFEVSAKENKNIDEVFSTLFEKTIAVSNTNQ